MQGLANQVSAVGWNVGVVFAEDLDLCQRTYYYQLTTRKKKDIPSTAPL